MAEPQNVQIPAELFDKIALFFECLSISGHEFPGIYDFHGILSELRKKQQRINLRSAYTKIVHAGDGGQRRRARADYIKLKNERG